MHEKHLVLYKFNTCPYCLRVMFFVWKTNLFAPKIALTYKDIRKDPAARQQLLQQGGKVQVPCLMIDGTPLYESAEIIRYLAQICP